MPRLQSRGGDFSGRPRPLGGGGKVPAPTPPGNLSLGDRVAYARHWIVAVQAHHLADARGWVIEAGGNLLRVEWDGGPACGAPVLARNLVRVDRMRLEPV